jgi:hypothetical protein
MSLRWMALAGFLPAALLAQPQIGGGQCSSATLSGNYSLTLTGRQFSQRSGSAGTGLGFASVLQGVGYATFDGLSKVTFTVTNNSNSTADTAVTWSGTYSLQANCVGTVTITAGDAATFTLGSYNEGADYFIDGYDGTFSLLGSGSTLPSSCTASLLSGTYEFNGNGFVLSSGVVGTVNEISGVITFDGVSAANANWYVSVTGGTQNDTATGTYTVSSNCTAAATVSDASGSKYVLQLVITAAKGTNFLIDGASPAMMFLGSGRTL